MVVGFRRCQKVLVDCSALAGSRSRERRRHLAESLDQLPRPIRQLRPETAAEVPLPPLPVTFRPRQRPLRQL